MSKFTELLKLAIETEMQCREYNKPNHLTAEAFTLEAFKFAETTPEKVKKLHRAMEASRDKFAKSWGFLNFSIRQLKDGTIKSTNGLKPLHLRWLAMGDLDGVCIELGTIPATPQELFALAVVITSERYPDAFGEIKNWKTYLQKEKDSRSLRDKLFEQIASSYTPEDLLIGPVDGKGMAQITFKVGGGVVPLAPVNSAGERLVNHLVDNPEVLEEPKTRVVRVKKRGVIA